MKKSYVLLLAGVLCAANGNTDVLQKIDKLQKELKDLKTQYNRDIADLTQRVDENEFQSALDKIKWGGEFIVNVGNYYIDLNGNKYANTNKWDMRVALNMNAKINEKTKFTGRLMMTKAWGSSVPLNLSYLDATQGRADGTSALYVERAYVDYFFTKNFVATLGRQPSSDGPGMNLKFDSKRKATYPALLFNGAADGIVLTYKIRNFIPKFKVRFAYGKGYQWQDKNYGWAGENPGIKDTDVYGFFVEGSINSQKMGDNLWILTLAKTTHLVTNPLDDTDSEANQDLGDYEHAGFYFENNKAFGSRFNYFVSLAYCDPKGNGNQGMADLNADGIPDTPVELNKKPGYAYHAGGRYDYGRHWKIGYEFNHGSKYWFSFSTNLLDPTNKLAMRGNVHDFYVIYNMDIFQYVRFGAMYSDINYDYSGMYFAPGGEPEKVDCTLKYAYVTYDLRF
jgi:hypothetical protein